MKRIKIVFLLSGIFMIALLSAACSANGNEIVSGTNIITESHTTYDTTGSYSEIVSVNIISTTETVTETYTNEAFIETENDNYFETSPIVMVHIYENYAWSFEQEVTIIDTDGYLYYFECSGEGVDDSEKINLHDDDNWYYELTKITSTESIGQIEENIMDNINEFSYNFEQYKEYPIKEYSSYLRDYGNDYLYGIYFDENNVPQYIMLSQYGNNIKCINNDSVINFVDQMIDSDIFYTEEFHY